MLPDVLLGKAAIPGRARQKRAVCQKVSQSTEGQDDEVLANPCQLEGPPNPLSPPPPDRNWATRIKSVPPNNDIWGAEGVGGAFQLTGIGQYFVILSLRTY